jgi:quercetin dioxygenase-like cupin family protein
MIAKIQPTEDCAMKTARRLLPVLLVLFLVIASNPQPASGNDYEGVKVTPVKKTTTASNGQKLSYPKTDSPEITVALVEIPAGAETGWHMHPVPVYAYVLSGSLTVETKTGERFDFKEGDAIIEMVDTPHNGKNSGTIPAKLAVFYTGEQGKPVTMKTEKK